MMTEYGISEKDSIVVYDTSGLLAAPRMWWTFKLFGAKHVRVLEGGFPAWRDDPALQRMLALMIPGTVGLAATQVNVLVNSVLATSAGPGAVSWLNYAFRLKYRTYEI